MGDSIFSFMSYYCLEGHIFCAWVDRAKRYGACPECQSGFDQIFEVFNSC